jgi:hypothetical protein
MATRGTLSEATERTEIMALIGSARSEVAS